MLEITFKDIYKNYGFNNILDNINFSIKTNEKVCLIGSNGCGKSTILKLISKEELPTKGSVFINNNAKIGILKQMPEEKYNEIVVEDILYDSFKELNCLKSKMNKLEKQFDNQKSINKYIKLQEEYINKGGYEIKTEIDKLVSAFDISYLLNNKFKNLSGGEKTIVSLIVILLQKPSILILDEPTNHLDIKMLSYLEKILKEYDGTIVMVSHDRYFIDNVANKIILIENGKNYVFNTNYSNYLTQNYERKLKEEKDYIVQQKEIEKLKSSAKRLREFAKKTGTGGEMFYKRAKSIETKISKMNIIQRPLKQTSIPINFDNNSRSGNIVLSIKDYEKAYENKKLFKNMNLDIYYKDRICLFGKNGSGKTTLIKDIVNGNEFIKKGSNLKIGYIPQEIVFFDENKTVIEEAREFFEKEEHYLRSALDKFLFKKDDIYKRISKLSGGERLRLKLFEIMQKENNFLIFDEITNHIDIRTKELLETAIIEFSGTVLFISHDRYFINKIANKIAIISDNKINLYIGNYEYNKSKFDFFNKKC